MSNVNKIKESVKKSGDEKKPVDILFGADEKVNDDSSQDVAEVEAAAAKDEDKGDEGMDMLVQELNDIIEDKKPKKEAKPDMVGIYFEHDVKVALDKYQRDNGRGAKSDLLNSLARYAMKKKGYLK